MGSKGKAKLCHLYMNAPDQIFERELQAEAQRLARELTRGGFAIRIEARYGHGDEKVQKQQIEEDRRAAASPDLFIVIPINQDAIYSIVAETLSSSTTVTCIFLHQPLTPILRSERKAYPARLFSVTADQIEIGRLQARQLAAVLPNETGSVLYVQGEEHSYGTRHRAKGLLEELPRTRGVKLSGYRVYGDWSAGSVGPAVERWLGSGGRYDWIQAAAAQNDDMALALAQRLREAGCSVPVFGVDGLEPGKRAVADGVLAATVIQPLGVGHALQVFRDLLAGKAVKELIPADGNIVIQPTSHPSLEDLRKPKP